MGLATLGGAVVALALSTWAMRGRSEGDGPVNALRLASLAMATASVTAALLPACRTLPQYFTVDGLSRGGVMAAIMLLPTTIQALSSAPSPTRPAVPPPSCRGRWASREARRSLCRAPGW